MEKSSSKLHYFHLRSLTLAFLAILMITGLNTSCDLLFKLLPKYSVTYVGNGNTGGTVPTDFHQYSAGASVTVLGNTGSLVKTGYVFAGWNLKADGSGTNYVFESTFTMGTQNIVLFAKWLPGTTIRDGLVGEWLFNGNANDTSGNTNDGIVIGATLTTDRVNNESKAYEFDGETNYIRVPDSVTLNPSSSLSIAAWFKSDNFSAASYPPLVKKIGTGTGERNGYSLEGNANGYLDSVWVGPIVGFFVDIVATSEYCAVVTPISYGNWHFVVGTYDGSQMKLYYDGELKMSKAYTGSIAVSSNDMNIGRDPSNVGRFFKGKIDDVRIYSRELTEQEVLILFGI